MTGKSKEIIVSDRKPSDIDTIAIFKPVTFINGREQTIDSTLSLVAQHNLAKAVDEIFPQRIAIFDFDVDSEYQEHNNKVLFTIADDIHNNKAEHAEPFIAGIIKSMEHLHLNYSLAIVQIGSSPQADTTRATPMLSTEFGKSFKSFSYIYCIIFDREKKNIAFFGSSRYDHSEPCVKKNTDEQLTKIFKKYFKS